MLGERDIHAAILANPCLVCGMHSYGKGKRQARGGSQSQVVEPGKFRGVDTHQRHRCPAQVHLPEGLGGRHTLSRVSLDSQRRGEIRGLEVIGEHPDPLLSISTLASEETYKREFAY